MHLSNIRPYVMYVVMQLCGHLRPLTYWIAAVKAYFILWNTYLLVIELLKHYTTNSFAIKFSLFAEDSYIIQINLIFPQNAKLYIRWPTIKYFICKEAYKLYANIAKVSTNDFLLNRIDANIKQHIIDVER